MNSELGTIIINIGGVHLCGLWTDDGCAGLEFLQVVHTVLTLIIDRRDVQSVTNTP